MGEDEPGGLIPGPAEPGPTSNPRSAPRKVGRTSLWPDALLSAPESHYQVKLDPSARERFTVWMDTYTQRFGSFSADQERRLEDLRRACADLLTEPAPPVHAAAKEGALRTASIGAE